MGTFLLTFACLVLAGTALEFNPSPRVCTEMLIDGVQLQRSQSPYDITLSKTGYSPSELVQVNINATVGYKIAGFLIEARALDFPGDNGDAVGYFGKVSGTENICAGSVGNALTHQSGFQATPSLALYWTGPPRSQGHLRFYVSLVAENGQFWATEESPILLDNSRDPPTTSTRSPSQINPAAVMELNTCGKSKGCYRNPPGCRLEECDLVMTWRDYTEYVEFELSGTSDGWIAFALSKDKLMGKDDVIECVWNERESKVEVYQSLNAREGKRNTRLESAGDGLDNIESHRADGRTYCRMHKKKYPAVQQTFYDLTDEYHILMAKGRVKKNGEKMRHQLEPFKNPYISTRKVYMRDTVNINNTTRWILVKLHGCLMLLAFMLCAPVAVMMAKYYKLMWPNDRLCGERVWFAVHRGCQCVTLVAAIIGVILILIHVGGYSQMPDLPDRAHPIIGFIVTVIVILNPLIALCRCNPKSSKRPIFNWIHWFFGTIGMVLAVVNLFIGLSLFKTFFHWWGTWVLVFFYLFHLIIELMLEIHGCINGRKQKRRTENYEMTRRDYPSPKGDFRPLEPEPVGTHFKCRILVVYLVVAVICFILAIIALAIG